MKRGSSILLVMILLYLLIAGVMVLLSGSSGTAALKPAEPEVTTDDLSELIKGDADPNSQETAVQTVIINETQDEVTEPDTEPEPEPEPEPDTSDKHFYRFTASHSSMGLRVRMTPSMKGDILGRIQPGAKGYVIEQGDAWSEIITEDGKLKGYSFNEYLDIEEIPEEEYRAGIEAAMQASPASQTE